MSLFSVFRTQIHNHLFLHSCEAMLAIWLPPFMLIVVLTFLYGNLIGVFVLVAFLVGLLLWQYIFSGIRNSQYPVMRAFRSSEIEDIESHPADNHVLNARLRNRREELNFPCLVPKAQIISLAMKALPPVLCFQTTHHSHQTDCSICMEEFKNGELVQPFGLCLHLFHLYCINSWLRYGKTNCPVCRKDLSLAAHSHR